MNFNNLKMVVLDLDGTVLNNQHKFGELTIKTLNYLLARGIKILFATGRSFTNCLPVFEEKAFDSHNCNVYLAGLNGSEVEQLDSEKILMIRSIEKQIAIELTKEIQSNKDDKILCAFGYRNQDYKKVYFLINGNDAFAKNYIENYWNSFKQVKSGKFAKMIIQEDISNLENYEILKFFVVMKQKALDDIVKNWQDKLTMSYEVMPFFNGYYISEITALNVSKALAIETMCHKFDINPKTEVVCFGNESNDIPMFMYVENSVAMLNAFPHIRNAAKMVTDYSNDDEGVARWLIKNFKIEF